MHPFHMVSDQSRPGRQEEADSLIWWGVIAERLRFAAANTKEQDGSKKTTTGNSSLTQTAVTDWSKSRCVPCANRLYRDLGHDHNETPAT